MDNFGTLLKKLRINAGLTQKDFASKLNTTDTTVSSWENNKRLPDILTLRDIAQLLNVTYDELLNPKQTLEKFENQQDFTLSSKVITANQPSLKPLHFLSKKNVFIGLILLIIATCISLFAIPLFKQPNLEFIEARTNVESDFGPAYELVYCINTKISEDFLLSHSDSLAEAWKTGTYNDCNENIFIVSYYLSKNDTNNKDNVFFQAFSSRYGDYSPYPYIKPYVPY